LLAYGQINKFASPCTGCPIHRDAMGGIVERSSISLLFVIPERSGTESVS